ncbi:MAG: hemerythrin domain-containing protein [Gammaproteobacteria bacterium]
MLRFDPIDALQQEHLALQKMFALHQEALVTRAWARAAHLLEHYQKRFARHVELEERFLLPYCPKEKTAAQWPASVYTSEHRRAEEFLQKAAAQLALARRRGVKPSALIALLDHEKTFKGLIEHHDEREEKALFCLLREAMPEDVQLGLIKALRHPQAGAHESAV